MGFGFSMLGGIFPLMFMLVFVIVIGMFAFTAISGIKTWNKTTILPDLLLLQTLFQKEWTFLTINIIIPGD